MHQINERKSNKLQGRITLKTYNLKYTNTELAKPFNMLHPVSYQNLRTIENNFINELENSAKGKKTSLPFIIHSMPDCPLVNEDESFQVMVIGGSVFKQALAKKKNNKIILMDIMENPAPVFKNNTDLFCLIEKYLSPNVRVVAINFAYPLKPIKVNGRLDGMLICGTKEHEFEGLYEKPISTELEIYFWNKYKRKIIFTIANDTACLLLSGLEQSTWERLAGGIVGTGINFAFFLDQANFVNLESANFDMFPISNEAQEIDNLSNKKKTALFEKETSGAYLYKHFNIITAKRKIIHPPLNSTLELYQLASKNNSLPAFIARNLIKKSADLIAAQIAGIAEYKNRDMTFMMEGSMFWKGNIYKKRVEESLSKLIPNKKIIFISEQESSLLGAARLATL